MGQVEGAFIQGMGWVTTEELVWDGKGRLATHAPATYKIPVASDMPERFRTRLHMRPNATESIYRSKAVGEPPFMLGIAVYCAILDAVHACAPDRPSRPRLAGDAGGDFAGDRNVELSLAPRRDLEWCPGAESNHRHCDFQSHALPTELPGPPRRSAPWGGLIAGASGTCPGAATTVADAAKRPRGRRA